VKRATGYAVLRSVVVAAFLVLIGRLWYMQIVEVNAYRAQAIETRLQTRPVLASRGIIYDRSGVPLVRNRARLYVAITPDDWDVGHAVRESRLLSRILHHHPGAAVIRAMIAAHANDPTRGFTLKADILLDTYYVVRSFADQLPGVYAGDSLSHRVYRGKAPWPLAHILGYVDPITPQQWSLDNQEGPWTYQRYNPTDIVGQTGIESLFDHQLHGINGIQAAQIKPSVTNPQGSQITPWKTVKPAIAGDGIRLTIDGRFENEVAQDLEAALQKLGTTQGSAVVMNPSNGQILAMVSLPSYNPNIFTSAPSRRRSRRIAAFYRNTSNPPLFDISTGAEMPPGSIYKVITATAGLASRVLTPSTIIDDTGILQRCPTCAIFHGWMPPPGLGPVDIVHAIARSSDIYFYEASGGGPDIAGQGIGPYRLGRWARRYGLGQPTGIQLPGEAAGLVPTPKEIRRTQHRTWSYGDSYNMGIGQGDDLVTPLQMARVVSVIANGGNLVKPTIIQAITGPNGKKILPGQNYGLVPDIVRPHFAARWITNLIGEGMRLGVSWDLGTSFGQVDQRTEAAGKTGTAQAPTPQAPNNIAAWWMGFAPYDHPQIAVAVVIPQADAEGAYAAAPIASKIMMDYFHKPDPNWLGLVQKKLLSLN
jgi:penicillin-binding protein 2